MSQKKSADSKTSNETTAVADQPTIDGNAKPSKIQAVHAALDKGIESPSEIVELLKKQDIEITPNYVSLIKGQYRKSPKKKRGRPAKNATAPQTVTAVARATSRGAGLSPQDLADLASLVERAGSTENLRAYLNVLEKIR